MKKVIHGDQVHGDKVLGDKVSGDKITVGNISDSMGIAIGSGARAVVKQGLGGDEIDKLFTVIYHQIAAHPESPDIDKEELVQTVQKIQQETAKGEQANPIKVERWLKMLALVSSDIFDVTVACLVNPVKGIATVIRKVAQKAREEIEHV